MSAYPPGHFYSPVVNLDEVSSRQDRLWPADPPTIPGVDFRDREQRELLTRLAPKILEFDFPGEADVAGGRFVEGNPMFAGLDARMWFALLRELRPERVIEVGSGFTTLLAAEVNRRYLDGAAEIVCVDPYPPESFDGPIPGIAEVVKARVQDLPTEFFGRLRPSDVLFIDSSHVSKTGSDVNYLYLEVLPRLETGVYIHSHDIFLPHEYPRFWVIDEERSWNEQYLLRALLMYSRGFEVVFGCAYAHFVLPELLEELLGARYGGGSFWMRKVA